MLKTSEKDKVGSQEASETTKPALELPEAPVAGATPAADSSKQPRPTQPQVTLDESKAVASYANFCRVTGTPEELIIDFGLNSQPMVSSPAPIVITQRLIVNFYTAKRMLAALQMSIQRHEAAFGVLETDVQRRVLPNVLRQERQARA